MILTPLGFIKYDVHATCLVYYLFFLGRQFRGDVAILVFLKTMASYNPTSWTPSLFTEVPALSQESEQSCICVLSNIEFVYFYDFSFEFFKLFQQCDIFFSFYYRLWKRIIMMYRQQGVQKKYCKAEQYCFGARGQAETSLKIVDLSWKYKKILMNKSK